MENKLFKNNKIAKDLFEDSLNALLQSGIAEVDPCQNDRTSGFFLPLIAVLDLKRESSKMRIVYDARSRESISKLSFNDCIRKCPDNITSLISILLRLRTARYLCCTDIKQFFLQLKRIKIIKNILTQSKSYLLFISQKKGYGSFYRVFVHFS